MPNRNKITVLGLIKTHISYLSIIILVVGLSLRYSLPSLFPLLNQVDIKYFGSILVEFGLLLFVGNWLIDKYKEEVNRKLFSEILDKRIGLKGAPLLTELVNLINPFSYNLELYGVMSHIKKINRNSKKYDIIQNFRIILHPKQDNVHYSFGLGTTEEGKKPKVDLIKLNGKKIMSKEIREIRSSSLSGVHGTTYQIIIPLKKGKEYEIEIKTVYPSCMSDLSDGRECDDHEYEYRALTEKTTIRHIYDFPNFEKYEFRAEKRYLNIPDIVELDCKIDPLKKEVIIESGNLKNGDRICLMYTKKRNDISAAP